MDQLFTNGFIKLPRDILNWKVWKNEKHFKFYLYCVFRANYKDVVWRGEHIKRGQFITSINNLSKDTGLTVSAVKHALYMLSKHSVYGPKDRSGCSKLLDSKATPKYTLITVGCYDLFQGWDPDGDLDEGGGGDPDGDHSIRNKNAKNITTNKSSSVASNLFFNKSDVLNRWNDLASRYSLKQAKLLNEWQVKQLQARLKSDYCEGVLDSFFSIIESEVSKAPFLRGENDTGWCLSLTTALEYDHFNKMAEGYYSEIHRRKVFNRPKSITESYLDISSRLTDD